MSFHTDAEHMRVCAVIAVFNAKAIDGHAHAAQITELDDATHVMKLVSMLCLR